MCFKDCTYTTSDAWKIFNLTDRVCHLHLLIGKNGSGKSTIASALEILQKISQGINRMRELEKLKLISPKDSARGRAEEWNEQYNIYS